MRGLARASARVRGRHSAELYDIRNGRPRSNPDGGLRPTECLLSAHRRQPARRTEWSAYARSTAIRCCGRSGPVMPRCGPSRRWHSVGAKLSIGCKRHATPVAPSSRLRVSAQVFARRLVLLSIDSLAKRICRERHLCFFFETTHIATLCAWSRRGALRSCAPIEEGSPVTRIPFWRKRGFHKN